MWKGMSAGLALLTLAGCTVTTQPLTEAEIKARVAEDTLASVADQAPINGELSLYEAMARTLKYNLDQRVQLMERAVAVSQLSADQFNLLPQLAVSAGYSNRDNVLASRSDNITTGREETAFSTSSDQERTDASARVVWNVLDFGVSYLRAKQQADSVQLQVERTRKVVQNLLQETRAAYWQMVAAQRVVDQLQQQREQILAALDTAAGMQQRALKQPLVVLTYRRDLLATLRELNRRQGTLLLARTQLARLMNLPAGTAFRVEIPAELSVPTLDQDLQSLQKLALVQRPELSEMDYRQRMAERDTDIAKLGLLPGLNLSLGGNYDSNSYTYNDQWWDVGVSTSLDLIRLASWGTLNELGAHREALVVQQRRALTMAVLSQVELAEREWRLAEQDYRLSQQAAQIEQERVQQLQARRDSGVAAQLDLVQAQADLLLAQLDSHAQYAQLQASYGLLINSLGVDLLPESVSSYDIPALTSELARYFDQAAALSR